MNKYGITGMVWGAALAAALWPLAASAQDAYEPDNFPGIAKAMHPDHIRPLAHRNLAPVRQPGRRRRCASHRRHRPRHISPLIPQHQRR